MMYLRWAVFVILNFSGQFCVSFPTNWEEYIAPEMLKKYAKKGDYGFSPLLFQGDISGIDRGSLKGTFAGMNNAITDESKRWKGGLVPYTLSAEYLREEKMTEKLTIEIAMSQIYQASGGCIKFIPRTTEVDYIHIVRSLGCYSVVGRDGGKQTLSLTRGCLEDIGSIQHELMHALGFYHENSRSDRDKNIWMNWPNLLSSAENDFRIPTDVKTFGLPYDYESVLHYRHNVFAKNNSVPTIAPKEKGAMIGQSAGLSSLDALKLKLAYECPLSALDKAILNNFRSSSPIAAASSPVTASPRDPPKFVRGRLIDIACESAKSDHCDKASWSNCPDLNFVFQCFSAPDSDIKSLMVKLGALIPSSPIEVIVARKPFSTVEIFAPVKDILAVLRIDEVDGFDCDVFKDAPFHNLEELSFSKSSGIVIRQNSLKSFQRLQVLYFSQSTVRSIEPGAFESLAALKVLALDREISKLSNIERKSHLMRFHCEKEYAWLRTFFRLNSNLLEPRKSSELKLAPGRLADNDWTRRTIYYPVDCNRDDLTISEDQIEFSVNAE